MTEMNKTMLNKINVYNLKNMLYFKKYKCNYYIQIFVLFFTMIYVDVTRSTTYQKYITVLTPYTLGHS